MRWILIVLGVLVLAWVGATLRLVFFPVEDDPGKADAVVVLSGSKHERLDRGLELVRGDVAPVLVISGGLDPRQPRANELCRDDGEGFSVTCFTPDPDSTRGEARQVADLASERGWKRVLVVTSRFHVTRARMLFDRCLDADVDAVGVDYPWTSVPAAVAGEWLKLGLSETVSRGC
ncbi:MAG: YdcF family protein [Gaiellaceae bacterium]